jgi:hypothetical protein
MSVRSRIAAAAVTVAAVAAGTIALPAAASAATPDPALTITAGRPTPAGPLALGATESVTFKVTNNTSRTQKFYGGFSALAQGALFLQSGQLTGQVVALDGTPTTSSSFAAQEPGYMGDFYPKAGAAFGAFSIPGHTVYSWKVILGATKAWPLSDNAITVDGFVSQANGTSTVTGDIGIKVGRAQTGGAVDETLTGGSSVAPGRPALETLTIANRTGATINEPWEAVIDDDGQGFAGQVRLAYDEWVGSAAKGHWQALSGDDSGFVTVDGIGRNATDVIKLRVRLVKYSAKANSGTVPIQVVNFDGSSTGNLAKTLTVHRVA